jgi:hypothetical protein
MDISVPGPGIYFDIVSTFSVSKPPLGISFFWRERARCLLSIRAGFLGRNPPPFIKKCVLRAQKSPVLQVEQTLRYMYTVKCLFRGLASELEWRKCWVFLMERSPPVSQAFGHVGSSRLVPRGDETSPNAQSR